MNRVKNHDHSSGLVLSCSAERDFQQYTVYPIPYTVPLHRTPYTFFLFTLTSADKGCHKKQQGPRALLRMKVWLFVNF